MRALSFDRHGGAEVLQFGEPAYPGCTARFGPHSCCRYRCQPSGLAAAQRSVQAIHETLAPVCSRPRRRGHRRGSRVTCRKPSGRRRGVRHDPSPRRGRLRRICCTPRDARCPRTPNARIGRRSGTPLSRVDRASGLARPRPPPRRPGGPRCRSIGRRRPSRGPDCEGVWSVGDGPLRISSYDFVRGLGADRVLDYADPASVAGPAQYDAVFDTMALSAFTHWRRVLRPHGTVVTVNPVIGKLVPAFITRVLGVPHLRSFFVEPGREDLAALRDLVDGGKVQPRIQQRFRFERAADAYRLSEGGHVQGKLVIDVA